MNIGEDGNKEAKLIKLTDGFIYGQNADMAIDCPYGTQLTDPCKCTDKGGLMSLMGTVSVNKKHPYKIKSYANWQTETLMTNVQFINFKSEKTSGCQKRQAAIFLNEGGSDEIPIQFFNLPIMTNVKLEALAYIMPPSPGWANMDDCGNFPCTAPNNVIINFRNAVFRVTDGTTPLPSFWVSGTLDYDF